MRTVPSETIAAITSKETYKAWVKAEVDPSRSYFSTLTNDNPYDGGDYSTINDTPVGQCVVYSPTNSGAVTFIVDSSTGVIYAMVQGSGTKHNTGLTAATDTKPAVFPEQGGTCNLWYWSSGGQLTSVNVNMSSWGTSGSTNKTPVTPGWTIVKGSPSAIAADEVIFTYQTSKGGLGVVYYDGVTWNNWKGRFISPNTVTDSGYWSIWSTGARLGDKVFAYSTDITTGEVKGVAWDTTRLEWGDSFIALPADLSRFCISNAVSSNGYIHMAGQFHRTEDLANAQVYSLAVRSSDGYTFSWDRFTLISKLGYRFHIAISGSTLYASDRNSVGTAEQSHYFISVPSTRVTLQPPNDIIEFSASGSESANLRIKGHDEAYLNHAVIKKGSRCRVHIGYSTSVGMQYSHYNDYIIDTVTSGFADGVRSLTLGLVAEGAWKASQIAFPFYSELISKSTLLDDCDERDHLYPAPGGTLTGTNLTLDWWHHDKWDGDTVTTCTEGDFFTGKGSGCERTARSGVYDYGIRTPDLNDYDHIKEYPVIVGTSINVKLYGWGRTDISGRSNDTLVPYVLTMDDDDVETWQTFNSLVSTYNVWPKEYNGSASGSYPIEYSFTGLTAGHRIKYIGLKYSNAGSSGETWLQPERIEVTGTSFKYGNINSAKVWKQTKPSTYSDDASTILEVPSFGIPYVQFLTRPYTTFNFSVYATFEYEAGDEPIYAGTIGWGVVGLAADGVDYILARYNKTSSQIELVSRRDGVETILDYFVTSDIRHIMLEHRDGVFEVRYKDGSNVWLNPVITHYWDEATYGVISTSETGIMHVGVYGALQTPGFQHCSLNIHDADGLGMIAQSDLTTMQNLPSSGKIVLDDVVMSYSSKTPTSKGAYGPWQARNTGWYKENLTQMGCEISHYAPSSRPDLDGLLLCAQNGHSWQIADTEWNVVHSNAGTPNPLRNRCRHYGDLINDNHVGTAHRMYEVPGLKGIATVKSDEAYMHPHGNWAFRWGSNQIWVKSVLGTMVDHDATIKDMTNKLCKTASIESNYPGDWSTTSLSISATPVQLASTERLFPGGYDVSFELPNMSSGSWCAVYASNLYVGDPDDTEAIDIRIKNNGGSYEVAAIPKSAISDDSYIRTNIGASQNRICRILFHDIYCSVYIGDKWVHTFAWKEYDKDVYDDGGDLTDMLKWPDTQVTLYMYASGSMNVPSVTVVELFDWREAIFVESEMSAASAIGSVIQERPIEAFPTQYGGLSFSYNIERDTITYDITTSKRMIRQHQRSDSTSQDAGSDAVVYYKDVDFASDLTFADNEGFITRVLKLSSLDTGAKTAALLLLEKANERQYMHQLSMRPDIRVEQGDRIDLDYTLPGTSTTISYEMIVESVSLRISEGASEMAIQAREDITL